MANRDVEQILLEQHRRLTNAGSSIRRTGLLDSVKTVSSTGTARATPAQPASVKPLPGLAPAPKTAAVSPINKGYTVPTPQSTAAQPPTGTSVAGEIGKTALTIFTSGLGLMPLISGLAGLFGGGEPATPPPLVKYAMPRPIQITAANGHDGGPLTMADYGQYGTVRSFGAYAGGSDAGGQASAGQGQPGAPAGQIVVNVQAMDSRSFLDHSHEIAQAVRDAMLHMHAINDVVSEL